MLTACWEVFNSVCRFPILSIPLFHLFIYFPALSLSLLVSSSQLPHCDCLPPIWPNCDRTCQQHNHACKPFSFLSTCCSPRQTRGRKKGLCVMASDGDTECCLGASSRLCPQHQERQSIAYPGTHSDTHRHTLYTNKMKCILTTLLSHKTWVLCYYFLLFYWNDCSWWKSELNMYYVAYM